MDKNLKHKLKVILGGGGSINFPEFKHIENILLVKSLPDFDTILTRIQ